MRSKVFVNSWMEDGNIDKGTVLILYSGAEQKGELALLLSSSSLYVVLKQ